MGAATRAGGRLPLLFGLFLAALTFRPQVVGPGPLILDIQRSLDVSYAAAGLIITIPALCLGLFAPVAPILAARVGAIRAVTFAIALIAVAGAARALVPGFPGVLAMSLLIGIGMGIGNALMVVAVKERFADRPLLLTGVYSTGIQLGSAIAAVLAVPIAMAYGGWRASLLAYAILTAFLLVGWILLTRGATNERVAVQLPRFPLGSGVVWLLALLFGMLGFLYYGMNAWVPAAYIEGGASEGWAGTMSALYNVAMVPGAIAVGLLGERRSRRSMLLAAGLAMAAATVLLVLAPDGSGWWMALAGLANGAMFTLSMSLPLDVADRPVDVGAAAAMMLVIGYLITAVAPPALGALRDATGSFDLVLLSFPVASAAYLAIAAALSPARLRHGIRT